ncbi:MAG TPA: hypothetical protein VF761_01355, partial [Gemmatimonadaceae bacterium]
MTGGTTGEVTGRAVSRRAVSRDAGRVALSALARRTESARMLSRRARARRRARAAATLSGFGVAALGAP